MSAQIEYCAAVEVSTVDGRAELPRIWAYQRQDLFVTYRRDIVAVEDTEGANEPSRQYAARSSSDNPYAIATVGWWHLPVRYVHGRNAIRYTGQTLNALK